MTLCKGLTTLVTSNDDVMVSSRRFWLLIPQLRDTFMALQIMSLHSFTSNILEIR